jgi:hypothetical protein
MRSISKLRQERALTRVEVLVVIFALEVLAILAWSLIRQHQASSRASTCEINLRQVGVAFAIWSREHGGRYPFATPGSLSHSNRSEIWKHFWDVKQPRLVLTCPEEKEAVHAYRRSPDYDGPEFYYDQHQRAISYFVGLTADETLPAALLTGDRNLIAPAAWFSGPVLNLTTNTPYEWSPEMHRKRGYVALADGSVQLMKRRQLQSVLTDWKQTPVTNMLLLPTLPEGLQP